MRDPRDSILGAHITDDLSDFGVPYEPPPLIDGKSDQLMKRAISWKYQRDIVRATPAPAKCLHVRFEDFVLKQAETLARLGEFLDMPLGQIIMRPEAVGRWRTSTVDFGRFEPLFKQDMLEQGYAAE